MNKKPNLILAETNYPARYSTTQQIDMHHECSA